MQQKRKLEKVKIFITRKENLQVMTGVVVTRKFSLPKRDIPPVLRSPPPRLPTKQYAMRRNQDQAKRILMSKKIPPTIQGNQFL